MKKVTLAVLILSVSFTLWGEYKEMGVGVDFSFFVRQSTASDDSIINSNAITIRPVFSLMLNDKLEIAPFLRFYNNFTPKPNENSDKNDHYTEFGIGSGVHWHFIQLDNFRVAAGFLGELYLGRTIETPAADSFNSWNFDFSIPLIIEVILTPSISIRASTELVNLDFTFKNWEETAINTKKQTIIDFNTFTDIHNIARTSYIGLNYRF